MFFMDFTPMLKIKNNGDGVGMTTTLGHAGFGVVELNRACCGRMHVDVVFHGIW